MLKTRHLTVVCVIQNAHPTPTNAIKRDTVQRLAVGLSSGVSGG